MIPKRLFFIWLGSELPDYGKFCIQNFKQVNPEFEIMLVNEVDVEHPKNEDVKECMGLIDSKGYNIYKHMVERPWAKAHLKTNEKANLAAYSDALRLYLLNKYGGIYLDLDTFPVKAFDEKLLSYEGFAVNHIQKRCDYFFLGFNKGCVDNRLIRYKHAYMSGQMFDYTKVHKISLPEKVFDALKKRKSELTNKFMQCRLSVGESVIRNGVWPEYYIDHFRLGSWCR